MRSTHSWMFRGLVVAALVVGLVGPASAQLVDRGSFAYTDSAGNTGMVNLIYDQDLDLTWVADASLAQTSGFDADGQMTWTEANAWAAGLTIGGVSGWRLPTADPACGAAFNCTGSEMGHLFYGTVE